MILSAPSVAAPHGRAHANALESGPPGEGGFCACSRRFNFRPTPGRMIARGTPGVLDAGHFALDAAADQIARLVRGFMN